MKKIDMKKVKALRMELLILLGNTIFAVVLILDNGIMTGMGGLIANYYIYRKIKKALKYDAEYEKYVIEENDERKNMIQTKAFSVAGILSAYWSLVVLHIFLKQRNLEALFLTLSITAIYLAVFVIAEKYYERKY